MGKRTLTLEERKVPLTRRTHGTIATLSSTTTFDSASRVQMASVQAGQALVPHKSDIPRMLPGFEDQLAKYTFGVKAPDDLKIVSVISKYSGGLGAHAIKSNPLITVIYVSLNTGEYGCFHIEQYQNQSERVHETFGFKYKLTPKAKNLHVNMCLEKGEVLSISPNVDEHGWYATGISANVAYMSTPATTEDGFEISDSLLERAKPTATGSRVAEWGKKCYPLNIYNEGDDKYRPFPEIGDPIREDGLVYAMRDYDDVLAGLDMTNKSLCKVDFVHDECVYGKPGAKVFDITIYTTTNEGRRSHNTPSGMEKLCEKYSKQHSQYYEKILECYASIKRVTNGDFKITPELQNLIVRANGDMPNVVVRRLEDKIRKKNSIIKTWRANPIDEWRVEVFYEYLFPIGEGAKFSNRHGSKGVICRVTKSEDMPVDAFGNRVDIIIYSKGSISRLNPGQFYEHFINACSRDVTLDIKAMIGTGDRKGALKHLLEYLRIASPRSYELIDFDNQEELDDLLDRACKYGIYVFAPSDDKDLGIATFFKLMEFRPPNKSQVTYRDVSGRLVTTVEPILVGEEDVIVLDKLDHKPMAVSGIRRQHHGFPAVENKSTKHSTPSKEQPPKIIGESEARTAAAVMGGDAVSELLDVTTNPETHRRTAAAIFEAENPMDIADLVDRENPSTGGRSIQFIKHVLSCAGYTIK